MREILVLLLAFVIVAILILTVTNPQGPLFQKQQITYAYSMYGSGAPSPGTGDWAKITCGTLLYTSLAAAQRAATKVGDFVQAAGGGKYKICNAVPSPLPDCPDCPKCPTCPACNCPAAPACICPPAKDCPACNCPEAKDCPACNCPKCPDCPVLQPQPVVFSVQGNVQPTS